MIRYGVFEPSVILGMLRNNKDIFKFNGVNYLVNFGSTRYKVFKRNLSCARCGLSGFMMALETHTEQPKYILELVGVKYGRNHYTLRTRYIAHFNLYGYDKTGQEILMTMDHIIPKSRGGRNDLRNLQTMCAPCNNNKADRCNYCGVSATEMHNERQHG